MTTPFAFGDYTLDTFISGIGDVRPVPPNPATRPTPWTSCLVGPDGCGKSILALHLASHYRHLSSQFFPHSPPSIIYVSTDLSHSQAESTWLRFGLDFPKYRIETLRHFYDNHQMPGLSSFDWNTSRVQLPQVMPN